MSPYVSHALLSEGLVEARAYQLEAVDEALTSSMLLVMPTAAGKTAVIWMTIANKLSEENGRVILIAPTVGLVDQHLRSIRDVLSFEEEAISITGQIPPSNRVGLWGASRLIIATPKVVVNDVKNDVLRLSEFSLLVIDEAHHCTGEHAMAIVCDYYNLSLIHI